jgi:hypothetical protein
MKQFDDNNLPDGARQAVLENAVEQYNEANNTHYDPFDLWLEYVEKSSNFKKK